MPLGFTPKCSPGLRQMFLILMFMKIPEFAHPSTYRGREHDCTMETNSILQELLLERPMWIWYVYIRSIKMFNDSSCLHNQECYIQDRKLSKRKCPLGRLFLITFKATANKVYLKCHHHLKGNFGVDSICHSIFFHRYSCLYCSTVQPVVTNMEPSHKLTDFPT